jgi:hypothetical protein
LGFAPGTGGGEVDAERAGSAVGGQYFCEAVAELRQRGSESVQAGGGGHSGEMQGVTGGVESAVEGRGVFAAERESGGGELKSAGE